MSPVQMNSVQPMFATDEILWYDNGRWGQCGYAIANPNGKIWTTNTTAPISRSNHCACITT